MDQETPFKGTPTAVPNYTREDWEAIRDMLPESDKPGAPRSYEEFVERVNEMEAQAKEQGAITQRVDIRPDILKAWCAKNNREVNRESIAAYGMWVVASKLI